ncbi:MAG: TetR/AcrR family transcriptional regulator [bacterium]|nr:MAG: TetR/AcrR family transcriptional regulator [bacterium]
MSRKEKILEVATELFARQGFDATATSEIARRAGVAQGTVFHHFKSKENLLVAICDELVQDYIRGITKAAEGPGSGWNALQRVLEFSQGFRKSRLDSITVAFRETRSLEKRPHELHEHFCGLMGRIIEVKRRCIERGQADGSIRRVPAHETALILHILLSGIIHVETQGLVKLPELDTLVLDFCRRGLSTSVYPEERLRAEGGG